MCSMSFNITCGYTVVLVIGNNPQRKIRISTNRVQTSDTKNDISNQVQKEYDLFTAYYQTDPAHRRRHEQCTHRF